MTTTPTTPTPEKKEQTVIPTAPSSDSKKNVEEPVVLEAFMVPIDGKTYSVMATDSNDAANQALNLHKEQK